MNHLSAQQLQEQHITGLEQGFVAALLQPRSAFAHKGSFGNALLIAGNTGKMGAALLATKACLRSGVGLLTVNVPEDSMPIVQTAIAEAMCMVRAADVMDMERFTAIGIGPGLGTDIASQSLVQTVLQQATQPLVIDADALNSIAMNKEQDWLGLISANAVITPHPKEFDRLFGEHNTALERLYKAIAVSQQYSFVVVLKGHHTIIAYKGEAWFNTTGNAGMAKGGSGDVLTGMITAFLAQQYSVLKATMLGVYLHGLAGDITLQQQAMESMLPSDLIDNIGKSFLQLQSK